ncbi:MAG: hypothetical protein F8N37_12125 [Telmatospirillum sp.]|nr:hypothetical protein [Telmatospirillum sp.]
MSGFVLLHRDLIGNPQFRGKDDEYAAVWIITKAAWEPTSIRVAGKMIDLERGQCCFATSYLAQAWECSKATAHARLRHFEKNGFIRTDVRTGITIITVCKYSEYQVPPNAPRTDSQTSPERSPNDVRTNNKEGNQGKEDSGGGGCAHATEREALAQAVIERFEQLRRELWPNESGLPSPRNTLRSQALAYLDLGGTAPPEEIAAVVTETMERGMRHAQTTGKRPTVSLLAFKNSIPDAIAGHRAGSQITEGQANGPRPRYHPSEFRNGFCELIASGEFE